MNEETEYRNKWQLVYLNKIIACCCHSGPPLNLKYSLFMNFVETVSVGIFMLILFWQ